MIRVFDRYLSVRNTIYFVFENALIVLFLMSGSLIRGGWRDFVLVPLIVQVCLHYNDIYPSSQFAFREFFRRHLVAILWAVGILLAVYILSPYAPVVQGNAWMWLFAFPFILVGLRVGYQALVLHRRWEQPVLVVGTGQSVSMLRDEAILLRALGYRLLYMPWDASPTDNRLEAARRLTGMVAEHKINKVVVALKDRRKHLPMDVLVNLRVQGIEVVEAISFYEQISGRIPVRLLNPSHLIFGDGFHRFAHLRVAKRLLDLLLGVVGLVLALPLMLVLTIAIKIDSRGPVLYQQQRVGMKGRPFTLRKFRSMRPGAEDESGPVWASQNDPRVTRVGRIMRIFRLDELPQIFNVLRGEMSFVGPRPERPEFVQHLREKIPYYDLRFTVKPGLTGWAQVKYRYGANEQDALEKMQYDLYYVKHLSVMLDITIMIETIRVILNGKGAQ